MREMPIVWKRLVKDGQTCDRCGTTAGHLRSAIGKLDIALRPLGIQPVLTTESIEERDFQIEPSESNRVWIAGQPLEHWLGASAGMSRCCSVCGDADCRTLEVDGRTYEAVPEELLVKAGLAAASSILGRGETSCCG